MGSKTKHPFVAHAGPCPRTKTGDLDADMTAVANWVSEKKAWNAALDAAIKEIRDGCYILEPIKAGVQALERLKA